MVQEQGKGSWVLVQEMLYQKQGIEMTEVLLYENNYSIFSKHSYKIPDNQKIKDIQIRPNEIAIICTEIIDEKNTLTRVHLFKQANPVYVKEELK